MLRVGPAAHAPTTWKVCVLLVGRDGWALRGRITVPGGDMWHKRINQYYERGESLRTTCDWPCSL